MGQHPLQLIVHRLPVAIVTIVAIITSGNNQLTEANWSGVANSGENLIFSSGLTQTSYFEEK